MHKKWLSSDDFRLRSPVIRKPFQAKSATYIVARVPHALFADAQGRGGQTAYNTGKDGGSRRGTTRSICGRGGGGRGGRGTQGTFDQATQKVHPTRSRRSMVAMGFCFSSLNVRQNFIVVLCPATDKLSEL